MRAATVVDHIVAHKGDISIHAAHEGCDGPAKVFREFAQKFQSTQPMRAATQM